jgi:DNA-binding IclR family transcriptional regulator
LKTGAEKISPEEYMLAALSPEERLDAAFRVAREAFRGTTLKLADVEAAVRKVRRKHYAARGKQTTRGR